MPRWLKSVIDLFRPKCRCSAPIYEVKNSELRCRDCGRPVVNWTPDTGTK